MYDIHFFKVDRFDYKDEEEKWIAEVKTNFIPRIGDNVAVLSDEKALEVINVSLYYSVKEEGQCYVPWGEVILLDEDSE